MKKASYFVAFCIYVSVLLFCICACADSGAIGNVGTKSESEQEIQCTENTNQATANSIEPTIEITDGGKYDIPGMHDPDRILEGIVDKAHLQDGANILVNSVDLKEFFDTNEAEEYILEYTVIELDNGSMIGFICYRESQIIQETDMGDRISGAAYEFVARQIDKLAKEGEKEMFLDSSTDYAYFIVSEAEAIDKMVGYYYSCKEGDLPD